MCACKPGHTRVRRVLLSLAPASTPPPQAPYPLAYPAPSAPSVRTSTAAPPHAQTTPIPTPATARTAAATMSGARRSVCATMPATCPPPHAALYTADGVCCNKSLETALYTAMPPRASAAGRAPRSAAARPPRDAQRREASTLASRHVLRRHAVRLLKGRLRSMRLRRSERFELDAGCCRIHAGFELLP